MGILLGKKKKKKRFTDLPTLFFSSLLRQYNNNNKFALLHLHLGCLKASAYYTTRDRTTLWPVLWHALHHHARVARNFSSHVTDSLVRLWGFDMSNLHHRFNMDLDCACKVYMRHWQSSAICSSCVRSLLMRVLVRCIVVRPLSHKVCGGFKVYPF